MLADTLKASFEAFFLRFERDLHIFKVFIRCFGKTTKKRLKINRKRREKKWDIAHELRTDYVLKSTIPL